MSRLRTVLSVPCHSEKMIRRAPTLGADVVMLDLEDGVAEAVKAAARDLLEQSMALFDNGPAAWVRVNSVDSQEWRDDLALLDRLGRHIDAVVVPKATEATVTFATAALSRPVVPLVESSVGIEEAAAVAALPGVVGCMFGNVDYVRDLASVGGLGASETGWAEARLVNAAAARGKWAIAGPCTSLTDSAALRGQAQLHRGLGFVGKLCLHPAQLPVVEEVFSPRPDEVRWARRVIAVAAERGTGAIAVEGEMVDPPVVDRARRIIDTAGGSTP